MGRTDKAAMGLASNMETKQNLCGRCLSVSNSVLSVIGKPSLSRKAFGWVFNILQNC